MTRPLAWSVIVPVKRFSAAKTRFGTGRERFAAAFALDTIDVVAETPGVAQIIVVTDEPRQLEVPAGSTVVDQHTAGLAGALDDALHHVAPTTTAIAVILGDLPALTAASLGAVFREAAKYPLAFVPDLDGTGTTMLTGRPDAPFAPQFGEGSAGAHEKSGYVRLAVPAEARRDVDTQFDLIEALNFGVGRRTAKLASGLRTL